MRKDLILAAEACRTLHYPAFQGPGSSRINPGATVASCPCLVQNDIATSSFFKPFRAGVRFCHCMESIHPSGSRQTAQDYQGFLAPRPGFGRTGVSDQRAWPPQAVNKVSSFLPWFHYFLKLSFTLFFLNSFYVECGCVDATVCV